MSDLKSLALNFLKIILGLSAGLAISEMGLRVIFPIESHTRYYAWEPYLKETFKPDPAIFPGVYGESKFSINSQGIRGDEFSPDQDYRILAIGGSTTESLYLDDTETWTHLLQADMNESGTRRVWVGNLGKSGLDTRHHIYYMRFLLPEYPRIDAVVILVGVNDLWHFALPAHVEPSDENVELSHAFSTIPPPILDEPFFKQTALWFLLRQVKYNSFRLGTVSRGFNQDIEGKIFAALRQRRKNATAFVDDPPDMTDALDQYLRNLNTLVDLAQVHSTRIIFMTQPSMWKKNLPPQDADLLWSGALENLGSVSAPPDQTDKYYTADAMGRAMDQYNQELLRFCQVRGVECIDIAKQFPQDHTVFYDDIHFNENGSRQVANVVAQYLLSHPPFNKPN